ncbi:MAG: type IV pilus biogenesis/stability protein PilW [Pseudomonadales bacterium]|nr:type IV pilus biogenesis/stability protein PilW [Pseudomonadales bacterium]
MTLTVEQSENNIADAIAFHLLAVGKLLLVICATVLISGCVTTIEGSDRKPAAQQDRLEAHLSLGRGYLRKGDYDGARGPLEKALQTDSTSPDAHVLMAIIHEGQREPKLAEKHYKLALKHDAGSAIALTNYGRFLHDAGRAEDALEYLEKATRITGYSGRALAYQNLGLAQMKMGNAQAAAEAFRSSLTFDPSLLVPMFELAEYYFSEQDFVTSKRYYDTYAARVKQGARSLWLGIQLERRFHNVDNLASYELALKNLYPASPEYALYAESLN